MTEFGHIAVSGPGFYLDAWGAGPFTIADERGKEWFFEDSDRFGPFIVHRQTHAILDRQPNERSAFWRAHHLWVKQGRRVEGDRCVWEEPKPTTYRRVARRFAVIVEQGDDDGKHVEVQPKVGSDAG